MLGGCEVVGLFILHADILANNTTISDVEFSSLDCYLSNIKLLNDKLSLTTDGTIMRIIAYNSVSLFLW